ncbi:MAG: hypothetical protein AAB371_01745 [Patescibacteria group bacterium]
MPKLEELKDFEIRWSTLNHYEHPYGDILWHLFWGVIIGASIIYSIFATDFLFLVIALFALIFFFHPFFYETDELVISLSKEGIRINKKFHSWNEYEGFEFFHNGSRFFMYLVPKVLTHFGLTIPLDDFVEHEEIRTTMRLFLKEYSGAISIFDKWYRAIFR